MKFMNHTKHIITGVIRLTKNDKIRIKLDSSTKDFVDIKNNLERQLPVRFSGVIEINHNKHSIEDILCYKLALKN